MSIDYTGTVRVSRRILVAPERAFDAWVNPALARRWLFAPLTGQIVRCEIDARPRGSFVITDRRDGEDVEHVGTYTEVERPGHLAFTFGVPKYSGDLSSVNVTVAADGDGCVVTVENLDVPPEWRTQTAQGWGDLLGKVEVILTD
ncbi:MAG: SRPBCC domain-containing protein [Acidobacteria bacterium]|nr:SRPBCC domain-containing protein [Acidobacteriota bacterium]